MTYECMVVYMLGYNIVGKNVYGMNDINLS